MQLARGFGFITLIYVHGLHWLVVVGIVRYCHPVVTFITDIKHRTLIISAFYGPAGHHDDKVCGTHTTLINDYN